MELEVPGVLSYGNMVLFYFERNGAMKIKSIILACFVLTAADFILANGFEDCPPQAVANLKVTSPRKPVRSGYVFLNGKYMPPPYRVTRHGTVIKINGQQVTGQIIPWSKFVDLPQTEVVKEKAPQSARKKVEAPAPKKITSVDDLFADEPEVPEKPKTPAQDTAAIDELFGDGPAKAPSASEVRAEAIANAKFVKTPKTDSMVKRMNDYRSIIHRQLLNGDICFFGSKYSQINVPNQLSRKFLDVLPSAIQQSTDAFSLYTTLRSKGFAFVSRQISEELFANIADSSIIQERRRKEHSSEDAQKFINSVR